MSLEDILDWLRMHGYLDAGDCVIIRDELKGAPRQPDTAVRMTAARFLSEADSGHVSMEADAALRRALKSTPAMAELIPELRDLLREAEGRPATSQHWMTRRLREILKQQEKEDEPMN